MRNSSSKQSALLTESHGETAIPGQNLLLLVEMMDFSRFFEPSLFAATFFL